MNNVYKITLNANNASPVITPLVFKQGDKGQKLAFVVEELDRTGATSALIAFSRSNGTSVEAALTAVYGGYEYIIQGNEFAVPGRVVADLKFYQGDTGRVSTTSFVFGVYDDTLDGLGGGAGGYSDVLEQLRDEGEAAKQSFIDATAEAMIYAQRAEDAAERAMQGTPEGYAAVVAQVGASSLNIQELKLLGWTVPKECPVQNEINGNVFIQKVGRVNIGSITWKRDSSIADHFTTSTLPTGFKVKAILYTQHYANVQIAGWFDMQDKTISMHPSNAAIMHIRDDSYTSVQDFLNARGSEYIYYELATPITRAIDGGEKSANAIKNDVVNLFNGHIRDSVSQGVSYHDNGDGTITLNGTATANGYIQFPQYFTGTYKLIGCPSGGTTSTYFMSFTTTSANDLGSGVIASPNNGNVIINFRKGVVFNNMVFKPMVTSNLNATIDDFVPYIGDKPTVMGNLAAPSAVTGDAWNSTKTYAVKEYAIYNGSLWRCKTQHSGRVPAENTYWTKVSICSELTRIATALNV